MDPLVKTGWCLYRLAAGLAGPPAVLAASFKGRFGGRWEERLGLIGRQAPKTTWFHAASVGEARSAAVVIRDFLELRPAAELVLSVATPGGLALAEELFRGEKRVRVLAAPFDFWGSPGRALRALRPGALVIWETELWPNLIAEAQKNGCRLILAAARLSERSYGRYRRVKSFMADLLSRFDLIAPVGLHEAELFQKLGAPEARIKIFGNPKFDRLIAEADGPDLAGKRECWRQTLWGSGEPGPLIVAGSTHRGEEETVLEAFRELKASRPRLKLLLAPRHPGRAAEVLALAAPLGAVPASEAGPLFARAEVAVLDSLGQLDALYGLAEVALVGGSLWPGLTGHNPLEPAAVARPVLFGPHMASFRLEAGALLAAGGARQCRPSELASALKSWLDAPAAAAEAGRAARAYLEKRPPAAPALARAIAELAGSSRG